MRRKIILLVFCLASLFLFLAYQNVIERPFPFLDVYYVDGGAFERQSPPEDAVGVTYQLPLSAEQMALGRKNLVQYGTPQLNLITQLSAATRGIMQGGKGAALRSAQDVFSADDRFMKICSEYAKVFCALAQSSGRTARVVWMNGHTVSELWTEDGWVLVDTYGNVLFTDKEGRMLGLLEVQERYPDVVAHTLVIENESGSPDYIRSGYLKRVDNVYATNRLFIVVSGSDLFSFAGRSRSPVDILKAALNMENLASALQYYSQAEGTLPVGNVGLDFYRRIPLLLGE